MYGFILSKTFAIILCQLFCKIFGKSITGNKKQNWEFDLIWIFFSGWAVHLALTGSPVQHLPLSPSHDPGRDSSWNLQSVSLASVVCQSLYQNIRQTIIVYACVLYIILMANSWIHSSRPIKILDKLTFGIGLTLTIGIHSGNWVQIKLSIESNILENRRIRWG